MSITIASLFTGAGGFDLGFKKASFDIIWANENDRSIWETFEYNFPDIKLDKRSILDVPGSEIPTVDGIIGGPPCQSWSQAGAGRGFNDPRGELFFEYIRVLREKQPKFFVAENVFGILTRKHIKAFKTIIRRLQHAGYYVTYKLLNANEYGVPQSRIRVIIVGFHKEKIGFAFEFPKPVEYKPTLKDAIWDLRKIKPKDTRSLSYGTNLKIPNHEYLVSRYSPRFMACQRVRAWNEPSYTIIASSDQVPLHPQAPKMIHTGKRQYEFVAEKINRYRRLSVRECARIQTFPDNYIFKYSRIYNGYKMVGNAVPVELSFQIAKKIKLDISQSSKKILRATELVSKV